MFGFLKNKLKEWVDKAKDKIKPEETKIEETIEEPEEKPIEVKGKKEPEKLEEKTGEIKEKPKKKTKKKKEEKVDEEIEKTKTKERDIKKIKEETQIIEVEKSFEKPPELPTPPGEGVEIKETEIKKELKPSEEKIKKEMQDIKEGIDKETVVEEIKEKKPGLIARLFGKKPKEEIKEPIKTEEKPLEIKEENIEEKPEVIEIKQEVKEKKDLETEGFKEQKKSFFSRLKSTFIYKITEEDFNSLFEDLEMLLLENNVALEVVENIKDKLSKKLTGKEIKKDDLETEIKKELKETLNELLIDPDDPVEAISFKKEKPFVILFFGINGTGKTTSIAKIAYALKNKGYKVALAAADTFRAASIEQIAEHAARLDIPLIKHDYGADPAAVGFDAIKYAKAHQIDAVLIDTAGRMHTKTNLIAEMEKIVRVTNPDLKIFVAESIAGNDAVEQAKTFHESINIDGSILSKADIDEKGGTIISVSYATGKPIFYLGTGQNYPDLKLFNKQEFIESLGL